MPTAIVVVEMEWDGMGGGGEVGGEDHRWRLVFVLIILIVLLRELGRHANCACQHSHN
jgi:hypothetical protein